MLYEAEGIVVRSMDYGEGDKIVVLLTKEAGKVSVMARGAKKLKSRHSAIAQLFTHGVYTYFKGNASQMGTLNHGDIVSSHHAIREHLHKSAYAAYLAELTDRLIGEAEGSGFVFEQLASALTAIEEDKDPVMISHIYEMVMLRVAGYAPSFTDCVSCGAALTDPWFSVSGGGAVCTRCRSGQSDAVLLAPGVYKVLRAIQRVDLRNLGNVSVSEQTKQQLKQMMRQYMDHHTGVAWKARHFIEQMEKYGL